MAPPTLVPDASVLAKLWFVEPDSAAARALRDRFVEGSLHWVVPSFAYLEVANAFRHNPQTRDRDVTEYLSDLYALGIEQVEPDQGLVAEAYAEARNLRATVYDALYLALAKRRDAVVVTMDTKFQRLAKSRHVASLAVVHEELA